MFKKLQNLLNNIFVNVENVIKLVSKIFFSICIIGAILYLVMTIFMFELEDYIFIVVPVLLVGSLLSFPMYVFGEILTQLKQINEKMNH